MRVYCQPQGCDSLASSHFLGLQLQPAGLCHLSISTGLEKLYHRWARDREICHLYLLKCVDCIFWVWDTKTLQKVESIFKAVGMPHGVPAKGTPHSKLHVPQGWGDFYGSSVSHSFSAPFPVSGFLFSGPRCSLKTVGAEPRVGVDGLTSPQ